MTNITTPTPLGNHARVGAQAAAPMVTARVLRHFRQVEKKLGIGGAQVWALHVVQQSPGIGVHQLARAMDVRQPTASNLVKSLADQGMLEVRKKGPDRRAVQLHVLAPGRDVLERAPGPLAGVLPQALASLDAETLARLEQDRSQLIGVLGANERAAGIPLAQM